MDTRRFLLVSMLAGCSYLGAVVTCDWAVAGEEPPVADKSLSEDSKTETVTAEIADEGSEAADASAGKDRVQETSAMEDATADTDNDAEAANGEEEEPEPPSFEATHRQVALLKVTTGEGDDAPST